MPHAVPRPLPLLTGPDATAVAAALLASGGLVGLPTETVYGLAAKADDPDAVARVFATKGRPADHPVIVHVASAAALDPAEGWAAEVPAHAAALARQLWPGPLTLILPRGPRSGLHVTGGQETVGLRCPDHPLALDVLRRLGDTDGRTAGLAAPSANRFGRVSPTTAADVLADLGAHLDPDRDAVLDGGPCRVGVESTIVACLGPTPVVLRPGELDAATLARVAGVAVRDADGRLVAPQGAAEGLGGAAGPLSAAGLVSSAGLGRSQPSHPTGDAQDTDDADHAGDEGVAVRAPGTLSAHYAPSALVRLVTAADLASAVPSPAGSAPTALLAPADVPTPDGVHRLAAPADAGEYARQLYAALRAADVAGASLVLVVPPDGDGVAAAVRDRLRRAAVGSGGATG